MKRRVFFLGILAVCLFLVATWASASSQAVIAKKLENAFVAKKPYPLVSQEVKGLTIDQAYEIQAEFVKLREAKGEVPMGYKMGLSSAASQKRFGVTAPVLATLFKSMFRWPGTLYQKNFARMFIEPEIGFRFGKDITKPIEDVKSLKKAVAIVFPAVELPDIAFTDMKKITGIDIIAANAVARKVLVGEAVAVRAKDLNAVTVKLLYNGQEITSGVGENAMGDQWEALKWAVNAVLARGGKIKSGDVIITGILTKLMPAKPGRYVADYGDFGKIEFEYK